MTTHQHKPPKQRQHGIAAVELAIAMPVLLLLLVGIVELGRVLYHYNGINQFGRDAARYLAAEAIVGSTDVIQIDSDLAQRTRNLAVHGNVSGHGAALLRGLEPGDVAVRVVDPLHVGVEVRHRYQPLFGDSLPSFGSGPDTPMTIGLRANVIMRAL